MPLNTAEIQAHMSDPALAAVPVILRDCAADIAPAVHTWSA